MTRKEALAIYRDHGLYLAQVDALREDIAARLARLGAVAWYARQYVRENRALVGDPKAPVTKKERHAAQTRIQEAYWDLEAALDSLNPAPRCWCQWETGDSPCPVHGMEDA